MAITSKAGILKVLTSFNPWWKTGAVNPKMAKTYRRFAFYETMKRLTQTDLRRTVILQQQGGPLLTCLLSGGKETEIVLPGQVPGTVPEDSALEL